MLSENVGLALYTWQSRSVMYAMFPGGIRWTYAMCAYGMYMTLEIFRPTLKFHIIAVRALSPECPQNTAFTEHMQTSYIVCEHLLLSAGSQIDGIVEHLITVKQS